MDGNDATKPGGQIFEHINTVADSVKKEFVDLRNLQWAMMAVIVAFFGLVTWWADKTKDSAEKAVSDAQSKVDEAVQRANAAVAALQVAKDSLAVSAPLSDKEPSRPPQESQKRP